MVYGSTQLDKFNSKIVNEVGKQCHYFKMERRNGEVSSRVHDAVCEMMDSLAQTLECKVGKTALGDLLEVVRTRLLVVRLGPPTSGRGRAQPLDANIQVRADAMTLKARIESIITKGDRNPSYWVKGEADDDLSSLRAQQAANSGPFPQDFLTSARKRSSGSVGGLLTSGSSSLVVPILTGSVGVG